MIRRILAVALGLATVGACSAGLVAFAADAPAPHPIQASVPTSTPPSVADAFSVMRGATIPSGDVAGLRQFASADFVAQHFAINPALGHSVAPADGDATQRWYAIPGDDSLCLLAGQIGNCASVKDAIAGRLMSFEVGVPDTPGTPMSSTNDHVRIIGMAPDDVITVRGVTADGQTIETKVANNVYQLTGAHLTRVELVRGDGSVTALGLS
jgi:hypothetical protein